MASDPKTFSREAEFNSENQLSISFKFIFTESIEMNHLC